MGRSLAAGGCLRVRRRPRHRGDRRTIDGLFRHSAGGWLCRLQGARPRPWRRDPARVLSCSRPPQICRGLQDDAVAVRAGGDRPRAGGLCDRSRDPRQQCRAAACRPPYQERTADGDAQGATDRDGRPALLPVEADSNTVERSMRPIAMGRRNSLFSGSEGGAESWAILSSIVNTAKLHDLDPQAYLTDVLERIVSGSTKSHQLHELLAWNWKAARQRIAQAAA